MLDTIENVKPLHEIEEMAYDKARTYLLNCRAAFQTSTLISHWRKTAPPLVRVYGSKVYKTFEKFNIPVLTERTQKAHEARTTKLQQAKDVPTKIFEQRPIVEPQPELEPQQAEQTQSEPFKYYKAVEVMAEQPKVQKPAFTISLSGEWTGQQIAERIKNIANLLENDTKYNIKIELSETGE